MNTKRIIPIATLFLCLLPGRFAQPAPVMHANVVYLFVEIETKLYPQGCRDQQRESPGAALVLFERYRAADGRADLLANQADVHALLQPQRDGSVRGPRFLA